MGVDQGGALRTSQHRLAGEMGQALDRHESQGSGPLGQRSFDYEMIIEQRPRHAATHLADADTYRVRFETRTVDDIRALNPGQRAGEPLFSTIKQVSEITERLYESLASPAVRALGASIPAELQRAPAPAPRSPVRVVGPQPLPPDSAVPRRPRPRASSARPRGQHLRAVRAAGLDDHRQRPQLLPRRARLLRGAGGQVRLRPDRPGRLLAARAAPRARGGGARRRELRDGGRGDGRPLRARGIPEAVARMLVIAIRERGAVDRRSLRIVSELNQHRTGLPPISEARFHSLLAEQALLVQLDPERAVRSLTKLSPTRADRERALAVVSRILSLGPETSDPESPLAPLVANALDIFEEIGTAPHFFVRDMDGAIVADERDSLAEVASQEDAVHRIFAWLDSHSAGLEVVAAGHRVVHGGPVYSEPVVVDGPTAQGPGRL